MISPKKRDVYAIHRGRFAGEMWIFCKKRGTDLLFLAIPLMENREVEQDIFANGLKSGILQKADKIPRYVYKISLKQFEHNEKALNN